MTHTPQPEDSVADNQKSLNALVRSLRLSQGQFRLILVRCNYGELRQRMVQRLGEVSPVPIRELVLPESVESLYGFIKTELADEKPQAVIVLGLESVRNLTGVFKSSNYIREELSHNFSFPLILWMNDPVWQRLIRVAPDLESWATTVEFQWTMAELLKFLNQETEKIFRANLTVYLDNYDEIELAWTALQKRGQEIAPELAANLEFVRGFNDFKHHRFDEALAHYQNCRDVLIDVHTEELERQGILLLHIALCYSRKAEQNSANGEQNWRKSRKYFQESIQKFVEAKRFDLIAKNINHLAEVLRQLHAWDELKRLAEKARKLHQKYSTYLQVAQDYGILAEVALKQSRWQEAKQLAKEALKLLNQSSERHPRECGFYRFILASACQSLGEIKAAIAHLEQGIEGNQPDYDPQLYIKSLAMLRSLYFEQGEYRKAFELKQTKRSIEYQYGFQAFAGASHLQAKKQLINVAETSTKKQAIIAQEIAASGREMFVNNLIRRIRRNDHKLTIIHGQSGVGKSSIIQAGLVPALRQQPIGDREAFPVVLRVYTNWVETLKICLTEESVETLHTTSLHQDIVSREIVIEKPRTNRNKTSLVSEKLGELLDGTAAIIQQLRTNADCNRVTVLIFDQFEEFFFIAKDPGKRQNFYRFLADCLDIPFVKLILSLREDYLHYLLECNRLNYLGTINHNILDKDILCYLGNFTPDEARLVIEQLTQRSQFYLDPELTTELVKDLAVELNSVRPIELQIIGAQLQDKKITQLEQYRELGNNSKEVLVKEYLEDVIKDCGQENDRITRLVLYWLTDENLTRPLKTRSELSKDLAATGLQVNSSQLDDLVLPILVGSGLVLRIPGSPDDRYQLVHDYLVSFIRQQQGAEVEELRKEVEFQKRRAEEFQIGQSDALIRYSEFLFDQEKNIEALIEALRAGIPLKQVSHANTYTSIKVILMLLKIVYNMQSFNRLEGHKDFVKSISFSPDGKIIASASSDGTIILWNRNGKRLQTLQGHHPVVTSISFSSDGKMIASGGGGGGITLWNKNGKRLHILQGHNSVVSSISFNSDDTIIASASWDKRIKLWNKKGELLHTIVGHSDVVNSVTFSPYSNIIASGSRDKTIKIWMTIGRLLHTLQGHDDGVNSVSFSPNGKMIASASWDKTVKVWSSSGNLLHTFQGHSEGVNSVSFSPDSKMIASASWDGTVKVWSYYGNLIHTFEGHNDAVNSVSFSPDRQVIVSASRDMTIKLWSLQDTHPQILQGHNGRVNNASFSPDGHIIASASGDIASRYMIKLWDRRGKLLHTIKGHTNEINSVSFSPDGHIIASASKDMTVKLWNKRGKLLHTFAEHNNAVNSISFSPDGQIIASASDDKNINIWNLKGELIYTISNDRDDDKLKKYYDYGINSVSFSPDGEIIASASTDKTIKLWSREGKLIHTLKGHNNRVNSVSFSPDSKIIASASTDKMIKLWSREGKLIHTLKGHNYGVNSVSFSHNGKMIASASEDQTVKIWNCQGNLLDTLTAHKARVNSVSFSPDSKMLASASDDNTVILWNLDLDDLLVRGCNWVRDYLKTNPNVRESDRHLCDGISN